MIPQTAVANLYCGYFHQDWREDYDDTWQALSAFCAEADDLTVRLPSEIEVFLRTHLDEASIREALLALGANYIPVGPEGTARSWLAEAKARTEHYLATR